MGYMVDSAGGNVHMKDELALGVGECIYGLGERFTPFVKNGQVIDMLSVARSGKGGAAR